MTKAMLLKHAQEKEVGSEAELSESKPRINFWVFCPGQPYHAIYGPE